MKNKMMKTNYVTAIKGAFENGMRELQLACEIYVQAIDEDYNNKEFIQKELGHLIPKPAWAGMEQVGRGTIDKRLSFERGGKNAKYIKRLALSDQKRIMDGEFVELLTVNGDGLQVNPLTASKEQAEQLFDGDSIRTLDEQKAYRESVEREWEMIEKTVEVFETYRIERGRLIIPTGCILTKDEVMNIALRMNNK